MTLRWPNTLKAASVMFDQAVASQSGGRGITGNEQIVVSDAGIWVAKVGFTTYRKGTGLRKAETQLAWRAMKANMEGRSNAFLIGPYERGSSPAAMAGEDYGPFNIPHSDDALFSDGSGYDQDATPAHVTDAAALGATTINITMEAGHTPEPGQYFGIGERLYLIKTTTDLGSDEWTLTFWPKLRVDAAVADVVNFDDPVCLMRLSKDDAAQLTVAWKTGNISSLDLIEAPVEP